MKIKMNRWELNPKVKEVCLPIIKEHIDKIEDIDLEYESPYDCQIDLSDTPLNPFTLGRILEDLGYKRYDTDRNGWEMDFWLYYSKMECKTLVISGCGMTFQLILRGEEE